MIASSTISARFTTKFDWVFVLTQENAVKPTEKTFFLKHGTRDF